MNSRLNNAEEQISYLEDRIMEITQSEQQTERQRKKNSEKNPSKTEQKTLLHFQSCFKMRQQNILVWVRLSVAGNAENSKELTHEMEIIENRSNVRHFESMDSNYVTELHLCLS